MLDLKSENTDWLLSNDNPSVKYRALTEILNYPKEHADVIEAKQLIESSNPVIKLFRKMHPNGYWIDVSKRNGAEYGKSTTYLAYSTTHFVLSYLAELGLDKSHPLIDKASERYLSLINDEGDFEQ